MSKESLAVQLNNVFEMHATSSRKSYKSPVTQRDLIEERILTNEAAQATSRLRKKRAEIRKKIELGAPIEFGNHTARLSPRHKPDGGISFALVVR